MKLIAKYNLINIFFGSILLASGGCVFYSIFVRTMNAEIDEKLIDNKDRIVALIESDRPVSSISPVIEIEKLNSAITPSLYIRDTTLSDPVSEDEEMFRQVIALEKINNEYYRITVRQVVLEKHDYVEHIGEGLFAMWLIVNAGLFVLSMIASRKIWSPFRKNIDKLKKFKVTDQSPVVFQKSSTKEFKELTRVMEELTEKVRSDYHSLKEFSENAAHEIQTPLMIIQTKLEDALQYTDLNPEVGEKIRASLVSCGRLSKLVQTMLFIAKIENQQFNKKESVDITACIQKELIQLKDFISAKNIHVTVRLDPVSKMMNRLLAEVLITNLLTNAIKHNIENGNIHIILNEKGLKFSNPSDNMVTRPEIMFDRFSKASQASSSHGLGLAIVKKICDQHNWKITYSVENKLHTIEILF